jgi:hypothetical protein
MCAWDFSVNVYLLPVMRKIKDAGSSRAGHELLREAAFLRLLTFCARGDEFSDAKQFSRLASVPLNQANLIWDICLAEGVLRESEHGFSTRVWMGENDMMPIYIEKQAKPKLVVTTKPTVTIETENDLPVQAVSIKKEPSTDNYLSKPINAIKEYVRPNVRLTRAEMESLNSQFSDAEVSKMLDILSDYKANSGRDYPSDYQAIQRWVLKRIYDDRQRGVSTQSIIQAEPLPDWVYGNRK